MQQTKRQLQLTYPIPIGRTLPLHDDQVDWRNLPCSTSPDFGKFDPPRYKPTRFDTIRIVPCPADSSLVEGLENVSALGLVPANATELFWLAQKHNDDLPTLTCLAPASGLYLDKMYFVPARMGMPSTYLDKVLAGVDVGDEATDEGLMPQITHRIFTTTYGILTGRL